MTSGKGRHSSAMRRQWPTLFSRVATSLTKECLYTTNSGIVCWLPFPTQWHIDRPFPAPYRTVVSYVTTEMPVFSLHAISGSPKLTVYDSIDEDVLKSYYEYSLASLIFYAMKENACSEQSARMSAMDSASKNAGQYSTRSLSPRLDWIEY